MTAVETIDGMTFFFFEKEGKKFFKRQMPSLWADFCFTGEVVNQRIENGTIHLEYINATPQNTDRNIYVLRTGKIKKTVQI